MTDTLALFWPQGLLFLALGYALGSIPFGLLLTRFAGLGDIRTIGSGNIGATNVLRTGNKALAFATLLGDALKGTLAVMLARDLGTGGVELYAALGAFLGHLFPIWLGFRGGKGVATFIGCLIGLSFWGAVGFGVVWLIMALLFRFSSLAALIASAATPFMVWTLGQHSAAVLCGLLAALLWYKHTPNIQRLLNGTESRIGAKDKR